MAHRGTISLLVAACLLAGCPGGGAPTQRKPSPTPASAKPAATADAVRKLAPGGLVPVRLTGGVTLISDNGLGIISNNSGAIIANNGGGLISDNGLGLISDNGLGYVLAQAGAGEARLAEARVEVLDAQGRVLADAAGKPITATSDAKGAYTLAADLPAEALVLRVRLFPNGGPAAGQAKGGELLAMLPKGANTARTADLDTASTLGAAYVLEQFVKQRQATYDKLPDAEALALKAAIAAAPRPANIGSYKRPDLTRAVDGLNRDVPAVAAVLKRIEAILVAGQADLGAGLLAVDVPLGFPASVVGDGAGGCWIGEMEGGRVRHVGADGRLALVGYANPAGAGDFLAGVVGSLPTLVAAPGGGLLVVDARGDQVRKLALDGTLTTVLGAGRSGQEPAGKPPAETALLTPWALALGPDGTMYVGEAPRPVTTNTGRILAVPPGGGAVQALDTGGMADCIALACEADGTLWALDTNRDESQGRLFRRPPGGAFAPVATGLALNTASRLLARQGGGVWFSESARGAVWAVAADGTKTPVPGASGLNNPAGMWEGPAGTLLLAQAGAGTVSRLAGGVLTPVAGFTGGRVSEGGARVGLSGPTGLAFDREGRLLLAEGSGHTINRVEGGALARLAGGGYGYADGPGSAARFAVPGGLAAFGDALYVADTANRRIRKVDLADPAHAVTSVAGDGTAGDMQAPAVAAAALKMRRPLGIAVDPQGLPYWVDADSHQVQRLTAAGQVELVLGALAWTANGADGPDGPAAGCALSHPSALAFDAEGRLYVTDTGNFKVRRVTFGAGPATVETFAGQGAGATVGALLAPDGRFDEARREAAFSLVPAAICVGPDGSVYVAELGSGGVGSALDRLGMPAAELKPVGARIRRYRPDGTITVVAGEGGRALTGQDGQEPLGLVIGLAFDPQGRLLVADKSANQVLALPAEALAP